MNFIYKTKLSAAILLAILISFTSCTKDENNPLENNRTSIVGTWNMSKIVITVSPNNFLTLTPQQAGIAIELLFSENNTYRQTTADSSDAEIDSGSWSISGNQLTIMESGSDSSEVFQYELSGNTLKLISETSPLSDYENLPTTLEFTIASSSIVSSSRKRTQGLDSIFEKVRYHNSAGKRNTVRLVQ